MSSDGPVVKTPLGDLQGAVYKTDRGETIYTFLGIPYAKPPVGNLRFKNPVPVEPWTGLKSATKSPSPASAMVTVTLTECVKIGDEDCLYLNVYTPEKPQVGKQLPVMVWIHGGGFANGCGNQEWYGPDYLVPKGVILVSINYRLAAFGFLSFANTECPGNFGLKDQSLGLKWVQQNISAFGGDPNNVTIFGESAGSASVHYQVLSPLSRGLFQKAIAQSACSINPFAYAKHPAECAFLLAKRLGYNGNNAAEALATITKSSAEDILNKSIGVLSEVEGVPADQFFLDMTFVPTTEPTDTPNAFLTKTPAQALKEGDFANVSYITGVCTEEMLFGLPGPDFVPEWKNDIEFQKMFLKTTGIPLGSAKAAEASKKLKAFYFPNGPTQEGFIRAMSFLTFTYGVEKVVEAHLKMKKATPDYLYTFNVARDDSAVKRFMGLTNTPGVCHADELEFLFTSKEGLLKNPVIVAGSKNDKVKENFTKLWTDFAKTGNPSKDWPVADLAKGLPYVEITDKITVKNNFYADETKLWDDILS